MAQSERTRFARAVVSEPHAGRLEVEAASPSVLVDRRRGLVYALGPHLVAIDLHTGAVRWKLETALGDSLTRVGPRLVVVGAAAKRRPRLVFVAPDAPDSARTCELDLPAPREAAEIAVLPFDRAGRAHVFWRGHASVREGGPPPSLDEERRKAAGASCGVVALDPDSCTITPVKLQGLLMNPPRDKGAVVPLDPEDCRYVMPEREMPSVAASLAQAAQTDALPSVGIVVTAKTADAMTSCVTTMTTSIEARARDGSLFWRAALSQKPDRTRCPGPP